MNILRPELVEIIIAGVREELDRQAEADPRAPLIAEIEALDGQVRNLTDAIAMGGEPAGARGAPAGAPRTGASAFRASSRRSPLPLPMPAWTGRLWSARRGVLLAEWRGSWPATPGRAAGAARAARGRRSRFTPIEEQAERGYRFEGAPKIGGLLAGIVGSDSGVPGRT